jgi:hypothetical protein
MVFDTASGEELNCHYDCFVMMATHDPSIWLLKGLEPVMSGGDCYDEVHVLALGNDPEELLVWAGLQGLSVAENPIRCQS